MKEYNEATDYDAAYASTAVSHPASHDRDGDSEPLGAHLIDWRHLPDEDAAVEWEALRAWVEWFLVRYDIPISTVPDCWYKHAHLVEELSALYSAHLVSFDDSDTGLGPVGFHERLNIAMPRLVRAYGGGCSNGHQPTRPRSVTRSESDWTAWTTRSHAPKTPTPGVTDERKPQ